MSGSPISLSASPFSDLILIPSACTSSKLILTSSPILTPPKNAMCVMMEFLRLISFLVLILSAAFRIVLTSSSVGIQGSGLGASFNFGSSISIWLKRNQAARSFL
ncbi:MAG: hypothetical protein RE472_03205 [Thermoplasmatales archaeon]|nr:MAG: hypothetical protein RE472_09720 [Thermoplasmatales archaeon]WMT49987.1 MAG: hypothetical protein RE472_03205 [Thermoplasmatales archaeon]